MLGDFDRAWSLILEFIQNAALSKNGEVSLAALKTLQEIMYHNAEATVFIPAKPNEQENKNNEKSKLHDDEIWNVIIINRFVCY